MRDPWHSGRFGELYLDSTRAGQFQSLIIMFSRLVLFDAKIVESLYIFSNYKGIHEALICLLLLSEACWPRISRACHYAAFSGYCSACTQIAARPPRSAPIPHKLSVSFPGYGKTQTMHHLKAQTRARRHWNGQRGST